MKIVKIEPYKPFDVNYNHNPECPTCKSNADTDRIPRDWLFKELLPWVGVKHYICYRCKKKFYKRTKGLEN